MTKTPKPSTGPRWTPVFSPWRHGGWYVDNVQYPSGAIGCVSRNYPDGKWRIVCDDRRGDLGAPGDFTFPSRDAAARAERDLAGARAYCTVHRPPVDPPAGPAANPNACPACGSGVASVYISGWIAPARLAALPPAEILAAVAGLTDSTCGRTCDDCGARYP